MRHGFLLIDKPLGPTSHDAVQIVRRTLPERGVGHLGTLDPQASGLLVLAVGAKGLKAIELFSGLTKEYEAHIRFGAVSTTYDSEGVMEERAPKPGWEIPEHAVVQRTIAERFVGKIQQVPPMYSAVHVNGERAYRRAMQGESFEMPTKTVDVISFEMISYAYPDLHVRVTCGGGTYIRSLANDLGDALRCGGYLAGLRRTKIGEWSVDNAVAPDKVTWAHVMPLKDVLKSLPAVELDTTEAEALRHGKDIDRQVSPDTIAWCEGLPMAVLVPAKDGTRRAHPRKVF